MTTFEQVQCDQFQSIGSVIFQDEVVDMLIFPRRRDAESPPLGDEFLVIALILGSDGTLTAVIPDSLASRTISGVSGALHHRRE